LTFAMTCGTATHSAAAEMKIGIIMEARPTEQPWSAAIYDADTSSGKEESVAEIPAIL
jgi:hypothetical protein